ncbi:hypothetical protein [Meiothermus phage MMP7]|nr:hypothetical protein [Meiothermus phage MMP7]
MARCPRCNGEGEIEHPAYRELDKLWNKGLVFDEEGITDFWLNRGCNPANPPLRYTACEDCGGTGDMETHENLALESRALAAWREANPQGLIGRLVELHQRDPELAFTLAYYTERYYGSRTPPGECWPYQWLMADVAAWPVVRGPATVHARYRDMAPDQTLCPTCGGWGRIEPQDIGESLADGLEKYPELGVEELLEEIPCPSCGGWGDVTEEGLAERLERYGEMGLSLEEQLDEEGIGWGPAGDDGYNPGDPPYEVPCPSCSGSGRWGDDIPCGWCEGRGTNG